MAPRSILTTAVAQVSELYWAAACHSYSQHLWQALLAFSVSLGLSRPNTSRASKSLTHKSKLEESTTFRCRVFYQMLQSLAYLLEPRSKMLILIVPMCTSTVRTCSRSRGSKDLTELSQITKAAGASSLSTNGRICRKRTEMKPKTNFSLQSKSVRTLLISKPEEAS